LQGVRDLDEAGQGALQKGHIWLEQVLEQHHQTITRAASPPDTARTRPGKRGRTAKQRDAKSSTALRLVGKQEQENGC
ncbi:MAG TPA: hypothetical protein VFU49_07490, partial [Ktedonobacteraceae bacterium]|nr:hypothetical protein [Ktedonobacteraceae bacterium]